MTKSTYTWRFWAWLAWAGLACMHPVHAAQVTGRIVDAETGDMLPARLYIQGPNGGWQFATSAAPGGTAVRYEKQNWLNKRSVEHHTTLSADPFQVDLKPGFHVFRAERGKEYRPFEVRVEVEEQPLEVKLPLERWVNMGARGWYSGDTHVHRTVAELPNVMRAEDLNVALPLTYWVTKGEVPPTRGDKTTVDDSDRTFIEVDATHVIYARNTEYEIFSMKGRSHTLGALFLLHHQTPFQDGVPPLGPVVAQARREGALLDLDKHNWPWSVALIPIVQPDLFELANNHHWRTEFAFTNFAEPAPEYMRIGQGRQDERTWAEFGFKAYYALLNSGFALSPTAGTASGVHPVPLGFGRVYVHLPGGFDFAQWMKGLKDGRSFVTTGPMLLGEVEGRGPGHRWKLRDGETRRVTLNGSVVSAAQVSGVEVIVNGLVVRRVELSQPGQGAGGDPGASFETSIELGGTSWVAMRCWEVLPTGRVRFAHTASWFFQDASQPLRPYREEAAWLLAQMEREWERSQALLPEAGRREYQEALERYRALQAEAVESIREAEARWNR